MLVSIFRTQPELKHVELHRGRSQIRLDTTDISELESLKANLWDAAQVVPGRPVKRLELLYDWNSEPRRVESLLQKLTLSTCGITDFTTQCGCSWNDDDALKRVRLLSQYLPKIERLCFRLDCALSESNLSTFFAKALIF